MYEQVAEPAQPFEEATARRHRCSIEQLFGVLEVPVHGRPGDARRLRHIGQRHLGEPVARDAFARGFEQVLPRGRTGFRNHALPGFSLPNL